MTAKTTHKKYKFDMSKLRRRARKAVKVKHKKLIKLSDVDKIWKDYVEYGIIERLIKRGKVQIDKHFSIEIVGRHIADNPVLFSIAVRGVGLKGSIVTEQGNFHKGRQGYFYSIEATETNFKEGKLIFEPNVKLKKAAHEALVNTNTYYRII